jgi:hypothetical protein
VEEILSRFSRKKVVVVVVAAVAETHGMPDEQQTMKRTWYCFDHGCRLNAKGTVLVL